MNIKKTWPLVLIAIIVCFNAWIQLSQCSWSVHQRDDRTIGNVKQAAAAYSSDAALAVRALEAAATMTASPDQRAEILRAARDVEARASAEGSFFSGWLFREEQKSDPQ